MTVGVDKAGDCDPVGSVDDFRVVGGDRRSDRRDFAPLYQNVSALKVADVRVHRYDRSVANERPRHAFLPEMDAYS